MQKLEFFEKVLRLFQHGYICDHCLGRQFAQLLSGKENYERGRSIRDFFAMLLDSGEKLESDPSNFFSYNFRFRNLEGEKKKCYVCGDLFENLDFYTGKAKEKLKEFDFNNFLVGTKLNTTLINNEEDLWEKVGIEWCEPLKSEINRLVGKKLEKELGKKVEFKNPEILIILDLKKKDVKLEVNSLYIYGEYNKLVRTIPQTRWPSGKYKTSVEQIVAKPFLKKTKGKGSKFHGAGREDIDAKCLAWRPFVLEILEPKKRNISLKKLQQEVNKSKRVQVRKLRFASGDLVEKLKSIRPDKTYRVLVVIEKEVGAKDLEKLSILKGKKIYQETPNRVLHRRADKLRKRVVKDIKWKKIGKKKIELVIKAEAGTYIKELVTGDKGRTYPSVSELLGIKTVVKELDVVKINHEKL